MKLMLRSDSNLLNFTHCVEGGGRRGGGRRGGGRREGRREEGGRREEEVLVLMNTDCNTWWKVQSSMATLRLPPCLLLS